MCTCVLQFLVVSDTLPSSAVSLYRLRVTGSMRIPMQDLTEESQESLHLLPPPPPLPQPDLQTGLLLATSHSLRYPKTNGSGHCGVLNDSLNFYVCLSVCLSTCLCLYLSVCLSTCLSVCLSVCLPVCSLCNGFNTCTK